SAWICQKSMLSERSRLRRSTLVLLVIVFFASSVPGAYSSTDWKNNCRLAHKLAAQGDYDNAARLCREAVTLLGDDADWQLKLDIQLNEAWYLIESGKLADARTLLSTVSSVVMRKKGTLLELRYWRRLTFLAEREGNKASYLEFKKNLLNLTAEL